MKTKCDSVKLKILQCIFLSAILFHSFGGSHEIVLKIKDEYVGKISFHSSKTGFQQWDLLNKKFSCEQINPSSRFTASDTLAKRMGLDRIYYLKLSFSESDISNVIKEYMQIGLFEYVEEAISYKAISDSAFYPREQYWAFQWSLHNS